MGEWLKIVRSEHCERPDSLIPFHTTNYGITTTPAQEWEITTMRNASLADMRHGRRLPNTEELWHSDVAKNAGLALVEVIVIVLYTGPMVGRGSVSRGSPIHSLTRSFLYFFMRRMFFPCLKLPEPAYNPEPRAPPPATRGSLPCTTLCCASGPRRTTSAGTSTPRPSTCWCRPS